MPAHDGIAPAFARAKLGSPAQHTGLELGHLGARRDQRAAILKRTMALLVTTHELSQPAGFECSQGSRNSQCVSTRIGPNKGMNRQDSNDHCRTASTVRLDCAPDDSGPPEGPPVVTIPTAGSHEGNEGNEGNESNAKPHERTTMRTASTVH